MTSHLSHYFQIKVFFLWKRFSWFAEYSGSSMHLLIDLKSPEYLNLPQHFTVSRTLQRATAFHIIRTQHSKKKKNLCCCAHHSGIFSLGNRWRWFSFTPRSLCPQRKRLCYQWNRRNLGLHSPLKLYEKQNCFSIFCTSTCNSSVVELTA